MSTDITIVLRHSPRTVLILKAPVDGLVPIEVTDGGWHCHMNIPVSEFHKLLASEGATNPTQSGNNRTQK